MISVLLRIIMAVQLAWFAIGCENVNFKAPVSMEVGYLFPGVATLLANEDGTYMLIWPLPPGEKVAYRIYKRTVPNPFDFAKPFAQTETQSYLTEDLRFAPKTCFVVRFFTSEYEGDKNTNEVCTKEFDYQFPGIEELTRDEKNIWTLSWKASPFKRSSYRVYEVDPNGALNPTVLRDVAETSTRMGPFPVGVVKCYVVRLLIGGDSSGDSNTRMKCTDSNRIGGFVGLEKATSDATGVVNLQWSASDNEAVVGYLVYRGTSFQQVVGKVDLRQTTSTVLRDLAPGTTQTFAVRALSQDGSEDPNTRTVSVEVKDFRPLNFGGLTDASVSGKGEILLRWNPIEGATEYRVYWGAGVVDSRTPPDESKPLLVISDGTKSEIRVQNLGDEMEHSFLVRAVSKFAVEDKNTVVRRALIPDQGAPVFRGLKSATLVDGKVKLVWDAPLGYVKQFKIFRAKGSAANIDFTQTTLPVEPGTSTASIIGGFQANQFYTFAVRAEDDKNQDSNAITATVLVGQQSLPVFSGYTGATALGERTLRVSFNVTNDANILQYKVRARALGSTTWLTNDVVPQDLTRSVLSWTIGSEVIASPLRAKTEYEILVTVLDIWGNESTNTTPYRISTMDLTPPAFDGVLTVEQAPGTSELKLNWMLRRTTDIENYVVYWSNEPMDGSKLSTRSALPNGVQRSPLVDGAATLYTAKNLVRGLTYYFVVHALDALGNEDANAVQVSSVVLNSFPSLAADVTTIRTPEREPGVIVNLTATDINLADALSISMASTTCPTEFNLPQLTVSPQAGGIRKAQVAWTPSQDFIQAGVQERTCTATYKVFDGEANSPVVLVTFTAFNRNPRDLMATIAPVAGGYKRNQNLDCSGLGSDDDGNPLQYDYQWIKNGVLISGATSSTLTPAVAAYSPNDKITCRVGVNDGHIRLTTTSTEITMSNSAPQLTSFSVAEDGGSAPLAVGDQLVCSVNVSDADGDTISLGALSLESSLNGSTGWTPETLAQVPCNIGAKGKTCFSVTSTVRRKFLRCKLENYTDGFAPVLTPSYSSNVAEVKNSTPKINTVSISPATPFEVASELTCNADVSDADDDALQTPPTFRWTRDGVAIEGAQLRTYSVTQADRNAQLRCEATLVPNADGFGSTGVGPVRSAARSYANSVPKIQPVQVTPGGSARTGTVLTCAVSVFDPDGDNVSTESPVAIYTWLASDGVNDVAIPGQINKTLTVTQDLRKKAVKCSLALSANADGRGAPAVPAVVSSNAVLAINTNPVVSDVTVSSAANPAVTGTVLTCNRTITDQDGDASNDAPKHRWLVEGTVVSGAIAQTFAVRSRDRNKRVSCSVELSANYDGQGSTVVGPVVSSNTITPVNSEPVVTGVQVTSSSLEPFYPGAELSCDYGSMSDADLDPLEPQYKWFNGATELTGITTRNYKAGSKDRGRSLKCAVFLPANADGFGSSALQAMSTNTALIQNREPVKNFIPTLQPDGAVFIHRAASVRCVIPNTVTKLDPDEDPVTVRYIWKKGSQIFPGTPAGGTASDVLDLLTDAQSAPGQQLSCQVAISDGLLSVVSIASPAVSIQNRPPTVTAGAKTRIAPTVLYASSRVGSETLTCLGASFNDPDGDPLTISYSFRTRDTTNAVTTLVAEDPQSTTYTAAPPTYVWNRDQDVYCEATAIDSYGGSISMTYSNNLATAVRVLNSTPLASSFSCNGGAQTIQKFVNESFSTTACSTDFDDGDGDAPRFVIVPEETTCPGVGSSISFAQNQGILSGLMPRVACQVTLAMTDSVGEMALNSSNNQVIKNTLQFAPPFFATWGRASMNNQCLVTFETKFTAADQTFGSSEFTFSELVGAPQQHVNPDTQNGLMSGMVLPGSGGGVVKATWKVTGSNPIFFQNLSKTVVIVDSPAVSGVPVQPARMPGVQVTPAPDASGLRADGCALADCTGSAGSIAAGLAHSCAVVASTGKLYCWGENSRGELGIGNRVTPANPVPTEVGLPANHRARAVTASGANTLDAAHTCAILEEKVEGVWQHRGLSCWGENQSGQLGRGSITSPRTDAQAVPQGVSGLSGSSIEKSVEAVVAGGAHTCAILQGIDTIGGGPVRCWGANTRGQLGDGTLQTNPSPVAVSGFSSAGAKGIAAGAEHTCVITNAGTVQCWGNNDSWQLGVQWPQTSEKYYTTPKTVPNVQGVVGIAAGDKHTCALLNTGVVKCWGSNSAGQLGDGTTGGFTDIPSPLLGSAVGSNERAISIAAGGNQTCALLESGAMKCWGLNNQGQLGDGTTVSSPTAVEVRNLSNQALAIEVGGGHTCVLKNTGGVSCFGSLVPSGLSIPQKTPTNNAMPQPTLTPAVPSAEFRNCRVLRSIEQ